MTENTRYVEVSIHEIDEMLRRVKEGENEKQLRDELIKNSKW